MRLANCFSSACLPLHVCRDQSSLTEASYCDKKSETFWQEFANSRLICCFFSCQKSLNLPNEQTEYKRMPSRAARSRTHCDQLYFCWHWWFIPWKQSWKSASTHPFSSCSGAFGTIIHSLSLQSLPSCHGNIDSHTSLQDSLSMLAKGLRIQVSHDLQNSCFSFFIE